MEADQRHADILIEELNLREAKGVKSPGEEEKRWEEEENDVELDAADATVFRKVAARANYLGMDRVDIQQAVKEVCKGMAKPTVGDRKKLKRLARFLKGKPRLVWRFGWQERQELMEVVTDSDWAGCRKTRRSTSGGVVRVGSHVLKTWSRSQKAVTLSSGEAEVVAFVKGVSEGIGLQRLAEVWGVGYGLVGLCDSTAAMEIVGRKGVGRIRHLDVGKLWV